MVLDIKWGRAAGRRQELVAGGASQLAVYTRLANTAASIGYYIIKGQALMLMGKGLADTEVLDGPSPEDTWTGMRASLAERLDQLHQGMVIDTCAAVAGNEPPDRSGLADGKLVVAPQPDYSPFAWVSEGAPKA